MKQDPFSNIIFNDVSHCADAVGGKAAPCLEPRSPKVVGPVDQDEEEEDTGKGNPGDLVEHVRLLPELS